MILKTTSPFILLIFCILTVSCDKYLNVQSNSSLVVPNDLESLQRLLDANMNMNTNICSSGEVAADDYFLPQEIFDTISERDRLSYIWENYDYTFSNDWAAAYSTVYTANLVLDQLQKIERNANNAKRWDAIQGAALYFRSVQFLSLVWTFSHAYNPMTADNQLGIVLRTSSDFNVLSSRASVRQSYEQVIEDLIKSASLIEESSSFPTRPDKAAVFGMLARTYLSMGLYDSAHIYAQQTLNYSPELIDFNELTFINQPNNYVFEMFNRETISYYELFAQSAITESNAKIDSNLIAMYDNDDLRLQAYFYKGADENFSFRGSYSGNFQLFSGLATDEIFLILAECEARKGNPVKALDILNSLLTTRYKSGSFLPYTQDDASGALDLILQERRKELVFRGLRWIDIKRYNVEGRGVSVRRFINNENYHLAPNSNRFALPLPIDVIREANIPQNPR